MAIEVDFGRYWYSWDGGECPLKPGAMGWVILRGYSILNLPQNTPPMDISTASWAHYSDVGDIMLFGIVNLNYLK